MSSIISSPNMHFLIIDNKNNRKFASISMNKVNISKKKLDLKFLTGKPLNSFWDITDTPYVEISSKEFYTEDAFENEEIEYTNEKIINTNNKEIYQSEKSQKLTDEEINQLKKEITNKDDLVKAIASNNTSMEKRTILSQEKYIKKKTQKYKHLIWITPVSLYNIVETFFLYDIRAINYLRFDSISTMLINSNFLPKTSTLMYEQTSNILTSAYAQRTHFDSRIYHLFDNNKICNKNLNLFNLSTLQKALITYLNINVLTDSKNPMNEMISKKFENYFDNLVICLTNDNEIPRVFGLLIKYLKNSGNIIIFAKDVEVLVEIDKILCDAKMGTDTKIIETITREYQVLPLRTHPTMNHKGYSGYVLTSYKTIE